MHDSQPVALTFHSHPVWAGLLCEAGEVSWPGYCRAAPQVTTRPGVFQFDWTVGMHLEADTLVAIGLYDAVRGGHVLAMGGLNHPQREALEQGAALHVMWGVLREYQ